MVFARFGRQFDFLAVGLLVFGFQFVFTDAVLVFVGDVLVMMVAVAMVAFASRFAVVAMPFVAVSFGATFSTRRCRFG